MKKRLESIDFVRGMSVLLLIPLHCMMMYATLDTWQNSELGQFMQWVEKGSPVFMVVMGFSFVFSKRQKPYDLLLRGVKILGIGYFLNFLKFNVPMVLGWFPEKLILANHLKVEEFQENMLHFFLLGDILQLAGFTLLFMAVLYKPLKNKWNILATALLIVLVAKELSGIRIGHGFIDYFLDIMWGNQYNVYFPLFPWMAFIFIGRFIGELYLEDKYNTKRFYKKVLIYSGVLVAVGYGLCLYDYEYHFGDYYHLGAGGTLMLMGLNVFNFYLGHIASLVIKSKKIKAVVNYASKNVTAFYILQWVFIDWGMGIFGFANLTQVPIMMIITVYILLTFSVLLARDYVAKKSNTWFKWVGNKDVANVN
ncbi:heparan-alpha-glucosaminide N-acetyltransferase domain-containing protein [Flammeovirga sp. SubArs3]|uniref:heparan-alpha-glucosaminide N-acetyltransferase domain-containing protein n=1 Tax=Flammeovirga sp. SubArs3 TaxID=2995316 RepID=UPI00248AD7EE|nr:heparan-alpha-glucosaminide N-acetyltransferase domain-containing protein [Flammeovirga sp. SubArs3]